MSAAIQAGASIASILKQRTLPVIELRILISLVCQMTRIELITQSERRLTHEEANRLNNLLYRRQLGEPIAYLTQKKEFYGLSFYVTPDVLIPRPETELLVELALAHLPDCPSCSVLELGTGSGAIAIALAYTRPDIAITAIDAYPAALAIAQYNINQILPNPLCPIRLLQSHWYNALEHEQFNLIVANPPYIAQNDPHLTQGDLRFEPPHALTDYAQGLSALHALIIGAGKHLMEHGWLLLEHGHDQAEQVRTLFSTNGWCSIQSWPDLAGIERVTGGQKSIEIFDTPRDLIT